MRGGFVCEFLDNCDRLNWKLTVFKTLYSWLESYLRFGANDF